MRLRLPILFAPIAFLAACGTTPTPEPVIITAPVDTPIATSCIPKSVGPQPAYPDTDQALRTAGSSDRFLQLVLAGRDQRIARSTEIEPLIEGCRK
jgi:hypothetical protein